MESFFSTDAFQKSHSRTFDRSSRRGLSIVFVGTGASPEFVIFLLADHACRPRLYVRAYLCSQVISATSQLLQRPEENQENHDSRPVYNSLFDEYPLLRSRPRSILFDTISVPLSDAHSISPQANNTSSTTSISLSSVFSNSSQPSSSVHTIPSSTSVVDLKPLKLARVSQSLDASKRICQYEIPGGGVCRDDKCEDLHLSGKGGKNAAGVDLQSEPSGEFSGLL